MNDDSIAHYYGSCYDYYLGIMDSSEMACSFLKWLLNNDKDANNNLTTDFYFGGHVITL